MKNYTITDVKKMINNLNLSPSEKTSIKVINYSDFYSKQKQDDDKDTVSTEIYESMKKQIYVRSTSSYLNKSDNVVKLSANSKNKIQKALTTLPFKSNNFDNVAIN